MELQLPAAEGDALAVVAGAGTHHAATALLGVEGRDEVVGAASLVGPADLEVLSLEEYGLADLAGQALAELERGTPHDRGQTFGCFVDV